VWTNISISGSQGIGLQTTILLAKLGATVYICAPDDAPNRAGYAFAGEDLKLHPKSGSVNFHELDLSSVESSRKSAREFKKTVGVNDEGRLDIIVGNAGIAFPPLSVLSKDGVEKTFAVNCLGHFVFVLELLGTLLPPISALSASAENFLGHYMPCILFLMNPQISLKRQPPNTAMQG
jgi:NAD(P)-dependent dehydrogenase (short-subunit alcohol dehydrogenase family)